MNKGTKGCPNPEDCKFVHPKMCQKSLNGINCDNKRCLLGHVLGTRDIKFSSNTAVDTSKGNKDKNFRPAKPKGHVPLPQGSQGKEKTKKQTLAHSQVTPFVPLPPPPAPSLPTQQNAALEIITSSLKALTEQLAMMQKSNQVELLNLWKAVSTAQQPQQTYAGALNQSIIPQQLGLSQNPQQFYLQGVHH